MGALDSLSEEDRAKLVEFASKQAGQAPAPEASPALARAGNPDIKAILQQLASAQDQDRREKALAGIGEAWHRVGDTYGNTKSNREPFQPQNASNLLQRVGLQEKLEAPDRALMLKFAEERAKGASAEEAYRRAVELAKTRHGWEQDLFGQKTAADTKREAERLAWEDRKHKEQQRFTAEENEKNRTATATRDTNKEKGEVAKTAIELRKEFQNQQTYKDTQTVASSYQKIMSTTDSGAGDISLIFAYMKLVDPGSTVREGEFATAASAGGVPDKIVNIYNKALRGEKLAPNVRQQFRSESKNIMGAQMKRYKSLADQYARLATQSGIPPEDVVLPIGISEAKTDTGTVSDTTQRAQGKDGKWYVFKDGAWEAE